MSLDESFKSTLLQNFTAKQNTNGQGSMKQPWNLFCQKAPLRGCTPIFHSGNDPDMGANAVGWRSVHGWQKKRKTANSELWRTVLRVHCSQRRQPTCRWNWKHYLGQTAQYEHVCVVTKMLKLMRTGVVVWKVRSTTGWMEASPVSVSHLASVPWPTHLSYGRNKVLLQPPPLWITSPSRCVHKT